MIIWYSRVVRLFGWHSWLAGKAVYSTALWLWLGQEVAHFRRIGFSLFDPVHQAFLQLIQTHSSWVFSLALRLGVAVANHSNQYYNDELILLVNKTLLILLYFIFTFLTFLLIYFIHRSLSHFIIFSIICTSYFISFPIKILLSQKIIKHFYRSILKKVFLHLL